ncbi:MAG: NAD/NADP octopine/nopaline dehydrogenase family protein [Intestinibacter sp.]
MEKQIAIVGAGNGGQAFAAYLSLHGHKVKIFDVMQSTVDTLNEKGGVLLEGNSNVTGFGKIELASTDIGEVVKGAEIVLVILPSIYHKDIAKKMAPYLADGQYVVLCPHASLGPVEFRKTLDDCGCKADIILACTSTLLFACRAVEVGHVVVAGQKNTFAACTYPASKNEMAKKEFADILPQFDFKDNVIRVSLDNLNAFMHPAPTLLSTRTIEMGTDFEYYLDFTPSLGKMVEALDEERMAIAEAFGIKLRNLTDEYKSTYETKGDNLYEVVVNCEGYHGIKGQTSLRTRYVLEDIPCSLDAIETLGQIANVPTPRISAIITVARAIVDGIPEGRTAKNLGLEGISKEDFLKLCNK